MSLPELKPFLISKHSVLEAWKRVKANQGAAGIDEESIQDFERKLKDNLYRIWNRMSSGSYLPPPVKTVVIPKTGGGERKLGIPTGSGSSGPDGGEDALGTEDRAALSSG
jgi:RNA-directed DNA polymerase